MTVAPTTTSNDVFTIERAEQLKALGERLAAQLKSRVGDGDLDDKAAVIADLMRELGYESTAPEGSEPLIEALNCVYHDLALADRAVCHLDLSLIGTLADADVEHRACMARGDNSCVFCLKPRA